MASVAPSRVLAVGSCLIVLGMVACTPRAKGLHASDVDKFEKAVAQICRDSRDTEVMSEQADKSSADTFAKLGDKENESRAKQNAARAAADLKSLYANPTCRSYLVAGDTK